LFAASAAGDVPTAMLAAALIGSTLGFLPYNYNPARIFLGDTGSMLLGYLLAGLSVLGAYKSYTALALLVPLAALGVPVLDTALAIPRLPRLPTGATTPPRDHRPPADGHGRVRHPTRRRQDGPGGAGAPRRPRRVHAGRRGHRTAPGDAGSGAPALRHRARPRSRDHDREAVPGRHHGADPGGAVGAPPPRGPRSRPRPGGRGAELRRLAG